MTEPPRIITAATVLLTMALSSPMRLFYYLLPTVSGVQTLIYLPSTNRLWPEVASREVPRLDLDERRVFGLAGPLDE